MTMNRKAQVHANSASTACSKRANTQFPICSISDKLMERCHWQKCTNSWDRSPGAHCPPAAHDCVTFMRSLARVCKTWLECM